MELVDGHAPAAANEIVIDRASADKGDFAVGDTISVLGQAGAARVPLAGIATYGGKDDAAGAQVVAFTPETATHGARRSRSLRRDPRRRRAGRLADRARRRSADGDRQPRRRSHHRCRRRSTEARTASGSQLAFLNMFLMTFAIVALLVGSFVIYNTFSITVAQRTKETALLRAIGAKRKQVHAVA